MKNYIGKWVVKDESFENPTEVLDVIEFDNTNNIIRAVGKNMSVNELLARYVKADEVIFDPYAKKGGFEGLPKDVIEPEMTQSTEVFDKHVVQNQEFFDRSQTFKFPSNPKMIDEKTFINDKMLVLNLIDRFKKAPVHKNTNNEIRKDVENILDIEIDFGFSIKKLIETSSSLGISSDQIKEILGDYILNDEEVLKNIKDSLVDRLQFKYFLNV